MVEKILGENSNCGPQYTFNSQQVVLENWELDLQMVDLEKETFRWWLLPML